LAEVLVGIEVDSSAEGLIVVEVLSCRDVSWGTEILICGEILVERGRIVVVVGWLPELFWSFFSGAAGHFSVVVLGGGSAEEWLFV
jgi:hypothetical protein